MKGRIEDFFRISASILHPVILSIYSSLRLRGLSSPTMTNLKMTIRYDGTEFFGWQTQPGFRTVQETFEAAVGAVTRERIRANASGRTDSGVHAYGQVANFFTATRLDGNGNFLLVLLRSPHHRYPYRQRYEIHEPEPVAPAGRGRPAQTWRSAPQCPYLNCRI